MEIESVWRFLGPFSTRLTTTSYPFPSLTCPLLSLGLIYHDLKALDRARAALLTALDEVEKVCAEDAGVGEEKFRCGWVDDKPISL